MRVLRVLALFCAAARADWDTYPVKSTNLASAAAPEFYVSPDVSDAYNIFDVHPVHGCITSDGGYVMTGKALESDGGTLKKAFAIKLSATGTVLWAWGSTATGVNDAANAVMQLPSGGDLIVAGYRDVGGKNQRSLTKLSLATGSEVWTATWADTTNDHGAWEMIQLTSDGNAVLLAGLTSSSDNTEFNFKSYGNVVSGNAMVLQLPISALTAASAPAESEKAWSYSSTAFLTSKAARSLSDGSVVALLLGVGADKLASLVKLTSAGAVSWGPTDYSTQHGEGTDLAIAADGSGFVISGQGAGGTVGTLSGRLSKVDLTGTYVWGKSYSSIDYAAGGSSKLIKNECWGLQALADGYVVGCGTGIEDCVGYTGNLLSDCNAGTADARAGALPRAASVWQSMIFRTDLAGTLTWLRSDQYRPTGAAALGTAGYASRSSAAEFVLVRADGGFTSINDEVSGIGLLKLSATAIGAASSDPCFPSSALVTLHDGTPARIDALKEGDEIMAATADGKFTTDTISLLSLAKPQASAKKLVTLTTAKNITLSLTEGHHVPFGEACCSMLKKAQDIEVGDNIWGMVNGAKAATMETVTAKSSAELKGLHSPVLTHGSFPIVDGIVTSFDDAQTVSLAAATLKYLLPLCKATGSCSLFRRTFLNADRQYIDEA